MAKGKLGLMLVLMVALQSCKDHSTSYFDQEPPFHIPKEFAPSMVNTGSVELNVVFNTSYTEMFFSRIVEGSFVIHHSERVNDKWTPIEPIQMYPDSVAISVACDPTITQDGNTLYFLGVDPKSYTDSVSLPDLYRIPPDVYVSTKVNGEWQYATKVAPPVSTAYFESYPIVVGDGSLYFQSNRSSEAGGKVTYRAQFLDDGSFEVPEIIGPNPERYASSTYVSINEDYLITGNGKKFQVSFKENDEWQEPVSISLPYKEGWIYYCPYMSPDEDYFFFSRMYNSDPKTGWAGVSEGEVYWVSADVIFNLK